MENPIEFEEKDVRIAARGIHQWEMKLLKVPDHDRYWDWDLLTPMNHARYMAMARAALYALEAEWANPTPPKPAVKKVVSQEAEARARRKTRWR